MEPWIITILIVGAWELIKFLGGIFIPESIKHFFTIRLERTKYSISNRVDYKEITKTVLSANLTRALQAQLDLYRKLYELHFESLYLEGDLQKKRAKQAAVDKAFKPLVANLDNVRSEIFYNMVFAPDFFIVLLHAQIGLLDKTLFRWHRFSNPGLNSGNYKSYDHSVELDNAAKWLMEKMHVNVNLEQIETFRKLNTADVISGDRSSVTNEKPRKAKK